MKLKYIELKKEKPEATELLNQYIWFKGIKNMEDLPENAKKYIYALEDFVGTKVSSISTSPEREDTILLENPFEI